MAGEAASFLLSRTAVPVLYYMAKRHERTEPVPRRSADGGRGMTVNRLPTCFAPAVLTVMSFVPQCFRRIDGGSAPGWDIRRERRGQGHQEAGERE
jgi:hypothetical protein